MHRAMASTGRSCHTAIAEERRIWSRVRVVVDLDLDKFFDRVHHHVVARLETR